MSHAVDLSPLTSIIVSACVILGAVLAFIGSLGLLRLRSFYDRVHAPTLGTTLGTFSILLASMLLFSALESRPILHELVIFLFMVVTTPVTFMLLVGAALGRDEASDEAPPKRR